MLFNSYKENLVYSGQKQINFPRNGSLEDEQQSEVNKKQNPNDRTGFGSVIFLLTPNRGKTIEFINDPRINLVGSMTKRLITDYSYNEKIGTKKIVSRERSITDKYFLAKKDLALDYVPATMRKSIIGMRKNVVYELSRWMEITFSRIDKLAAKKKCAEFIRILSDRLNDPLFNEYKSKTLVFDMSSWTSSIKNCIILNKRLLNNPLSILIYSACYYPDLLTKLPKDIKLMVINRESGQLYIIPLGFITKNNYPKIKTKLNKFKGVVFSAEDDVDPQTINENTEADVDKEVNAEIIDDTKNEVKSKLKKQLTSKAENPDDITLLTAEPLNSNSDADDEEVEDNKYGFNVDDEVSKTVDDAFDDINDVDDIDPELLTLQLANKVRSTTYRASFIPVKTDKELERIKRLRSNQQKVLPLPTIEDVQLKSIETSTTGGYVDTANETIKESKYVNFDKNYVEKCLEKNIDDSVAILSNATYKVFITGKKVEDSSDPMNLKQLYTYTLEDERGRKMTISFDVPKIIDGSYVYLNGTKKNIRHQFILKPIAKTGPDTVQLVTAYKKIFIARKGAMNQNINRLEVFLEHNPQKFKTKPGNCSMKNQKYEVPLDYAMLSRYFAEYTIGDITLYMSVDECLNAASKLAKTDVSKMYDDSKEIPIGINNKAKTLILMPLTESYTDTVLTYFTEDDFKSISRIKRKPKFVTAYAKVMAQWIPLVLFAMYCEGFASVMRKAHINYEFVNDSKKLRQYDTMKWDAIPLADGYIMWQKAPFRNELFMNGFKRCDLTPFSFDDLESKDTFTSLIFTFYPGNQRINSALDNFKDFMIDEKSKDILRDMGYPTDFVELMVIAAGMLSDTKYRTENDLNNLRIRSSEILADCIYQVITDAYTQYRNTATKDKPTKISIKRSAVIDKLIGANILEEDSALNPILEIEKNRSVTFKGLGGIQKSRAMTLPRRAYDKSMLGTIGISTPPDAGVGVTRQLTLEPQITSTYGYIDTEKSKDPSQLNAANLFTPGELLQPNGAMHDDPDRVSMSYKQSKAMVPIKDADPVLIGNKVEAVLPYLTSDEFSVVAEDDGVVIEVTESYTVIQYKSGKNYAIQTKTKVSKNSASGSWVDDTLKCDLKPNQKFRKGDVLAYNPKHYTKNKSDPSASLNLGALCKIAISSQWDVFEDSAPISKRLSEKLTTEAVDEKGIVLNQYNYIASIAKIGDKIKAGDPLLVFAAAEDEYGAKLLKSMREEQKLATIENAKKTIHSKHTGEVVDIRIYTTSPVKDLDPSLQRLIGQYWQRVRKENATLTKYQNKGDLEFYKAGQIIRETTEPVKIPRNGKVMGYDMEAGQVLILFYIKYPMAASKGDKVVCSVCKGIVSHVFEEGMEPFSEYRPDEPIDTIVAPLAVSARKVPNIFLTIFGNKLIIELKRQLEQIYLG